MTREEALATFAQLTQIQHFVGTIDRMTKDLSMHLNRVSNRGYDTETQLHSYLACYFRCVGQYGPELTGIPESELAELAEVWEELVAHLSLLQPLALELANKAHTISYPDHIPLPTLMSQEEARVVVKDDLPF